MAGARFVGLESGVRHPVVYAIGDSGIVRARSVAPPPRYLRGDAAA